MLEYEFNIMKELNRDKMTRGLENTKDLVSVHYPLSFSLIQSCLVSMVGGLKPIEYFRLNRFFLLLGEPDYNYVMKWQNNEKKQNNYIFFIFNIMNIENLLK